MTQRVEVIEVIPEPPREPKKYPARPIEMVDSVSVVQFHGPTTVTLWRGPTWPLPRGGKRRRKAYRVRFPVLPLIQEDDQGKARIAGARIRVSHVAELHTRRGLTPEQIRESYPHLTPEQVHAALAYYYGHHDAVEAQIAASLAFADQARREAGPSPLAARLRAQGRLPAERAA